MNMQLASLYNLFTLELRHTQGIIPPGAAITTSEFGFRKRQNES